MTTPIATAANTLEAEIVSLFAQKNALTHMLLTKIRAFDASEGWQGFESCAAWLAFRVSITKKTAQEQVRAARKLKDLPRIDAALASGQLSYSKVRALTRIATAANEEELLPIALMATAAQTERLAHGWLRIDRAEDQKKRDEARMCSVYFDDDGMCVVSARLRPEEGAIVIEAMKAARQKGRSEADALVAMAERSRAISVEVVSAEATTMLTPARPLLIVHSEASFTAASVEGKRGDKVPVSAETLRRLTCDATRVDVTHGANGSVLDVGRQTRHISTKLRLALTQRDHGCRVPGCDNQFTDAHHLRHWADGGETNMGNLISLCGYHHTLVHDGALLCDADGTFRFADQRPMTSAMPLAIFEPLRTPIDMPTPTGETLDYGWALSWLKFDPAQAIEILDDHEAA